MASIEDFREPLDHEFGDDIDPIPEEVTGIKLDGDTGLQQHCQFRPLKSVDYLLVNTPTGQPCFLEFSDIRSQIKDNEHKVSVLERSIEPYITDVENIPKPERSKAKKLKGEICKTFRNAAINEVREKYLHTCLLFANAHQQIDDAPSLPKGCRYIVVYPTPSDPIEAAKIFEAIKSQVLTGLPDEMCQQKSISIIPLDTFIEHFCPRLKAFQNK